MTANGQQDSTAEEDIPIVPLLFVAKPAETLASDIDRRSAYYRAQARTVSHQRQRQPLMTIPNILTFFRLVLVPVIILSFESSWTYAPLTGGCVFIAASLTDYLDGYLARKLKIATVFGAFLDPVADKIMVATALVLLTTSPPQPVTPKLMVLPSSLIICREITMSALREWAASAGSHAQSAVKVSSLGKWKTALQMTSMSILLLMRQPQADCEKFLPLEVAGTELFHSIAKGALVALWGGTILGLWSMFIYFSNVWQHFIYPVIKQHTQ